MSSRDKLPTHLPHSLPSVIIQFFTALKHFFVLAFCDLNFALHESDNEII